MSELPVDQYGNIIQMTPRGVALATTVNASLSSSVEVTLHADTTFIRIYAIAKDVYLRWGIENANASLFDEIIPSGQVVDLAVPLQADGTPHTAFNVIERESGATVVIIQK